MFMLTFQIESTCDERYLWSKMKSIFDGRYLCHKVHMTKGTYDQMYWWQFIFLRYL
jgi:hypothetical protein